MRHWTDFGANEVGMSSARRNDSNRIGHDAGSQFSDQSDDVPQLLDLKLYSTYANILKEARYPHPVMCGRLGRIDVFPDHPHEGETRVPSSLAGVCRDGSPEYPNATDGTGQLSPEIVAWGRVPAAWLDPWGPPAGKPDNPPIPWLDLEPLADIAIGGALVALRGSFPYPEEKIEFDEKAREVATRGASEALRRGFAQFNADLKGVAELSARKE
ncbi:hypothetical protein ALI22I_36400 [Saccharothrix sp. ALI-22-I]|uniref:hypothetical protein n=1 Tax=Saccharothrix sp. ALI-22-I TaxID=1933778 RepID=UPI00097C0059|nr:hypothetical protein [Saccharothrix sp. ALI-22-I]ONI83907.1 hypothetical protein ALI22I_36400 [Saccharothrix sp. ALI-22-I]